MTTTDDRPTQRTIHDLPAPAGRWDDQAACLTADVELFILSGPQSKGQTREARIARAYCAACPCVEACRTVAIRLDDRRSIRGGMTPLERDAWLTEQGITVPGGRERATHKRRLNPDRQAQDERICYLKAQGLTWRRIAADVGCAVETAQRRWKRAMAEQAGEAR